MKSLIKFIQLTVLNLFSRQNLVRVPESHAITDQQGSAGDYNRAINSAMILPYALTLDMVIRTSPKKLVNAIDLCCGPGHLTRLLAKYGNVRHVTGVDLSTPALQNAAQNSRTEGLTQQTSYERADITNLEQFTNSSLDLVTFTNGAHHMPTLDALAKAIAEADRVTAADGLIVILDPVRQKTSRITDIYHEIGGVSYVKKGLLDFNQDFRDSLYASWTTEEFMSALPAKKKRNWVQITPFGFSTFQFIIGFPLNQTTPFLRESLQTSILSKIIPAEYMMEWRILRNSFKFGKMKSAPAAAENKSIVNSNKLNH